MSKQIRLPEDFVKQLRQEYDGNNDLERLKSWKNKEQHNQLAEILNKLENLDVNNSSTNDSKSWTRKEIADIVENRFYDLTQ